MSKNYEYPLDYSWTHQEMATVIQLWNVVELAYEKGVERDKFLQAYREFKKIVPSKSEEKRLARLFEERSGYVLYRVWQMAQEDKKIVKMVIK